MIMHNVLRSYQLCSVGSNTQHRVGLESIYLSSKTTCHRRFIQLLVCIFYQLNGITTDQISLYTLPMYIEPFLMEIIHQNSYLDHMIICWLIVPLIVQSHISALILYSIISVYIYPLHVLPLGHCITLYVSFIYSVSISYSSYSTLHIIMHISHTQHIQSTDCILLLPIFFI